MWFQRRSAPPQHRIPRTHGKLAAVLLTITSVLTVLFFVLPLVMLLVRSAWDHLPLSDISSAVILSLFTTGCSLLLTLIFGTPLAYVFARWQFPFRSFISLLIQLPIVLPPTVAGLALLITWGRSGLIGSALRVIGIEIPFTTAAVILAQTFVSAPFYILGAQIGFQNVPPEIEEAALVDGASGLALFRHVTLPLSANALAAGLTLSWARAMGEFGATILLAGSLAGRTQTMTTLVYRVFEGNIDAAIAVSVILLGLALAALAFSQWLARRGSIVSS